MDPLETAIRDHLVRYLTGDITLSDLQDWLVDATRIIEATASPDAVELAYSVELVLAELSSGYLTPDQLRADLIEIAEHASAKMATAIGA